MRLEITAVAGPGSVPFDPVELSVPLPDHGGWGGAAVVEALSARWPEASFTTAGVPLDDLRAGLRPLANGAVVVVHGRAVLHGVTRTGSGPDAAAVLVVRSGPGAGAMFPLHRGTYPLGRGRFPLAIADPTLSRHHGTLTVGERAMTLAAAPGSTGFSILRGWQENPTVAAVPLRRNGAVEVGDLIRCGMTAFAIELTMPAVPGAGAAAPTGAGGNWQAALPVASADFPCLLDADVLNPVRLSTGSGAPGNRWAMMAVGLLPLAFGTLFAWLTGSWIFLAFAAMGAVAVLSPLPGGARRRRAFSASVTAAAKSDAARRREAFPGADVLVSMAMDTIGTGSSLRGVGLQDVGLRGPGRDCNGQPSDGGRGAESPDRRLAIRVGAAAQRAMLELMPDNPSFQAPLSSELPVAVALGAAPVKIVAPPGPLRLLLHFVLMQLDAAGIPVVLVGPVAELPLSARFLPVTLLAGSEQAAAMAVRNLRARRGPQHPSGGGPGTATGPAAADCVLVSFGEQPTVVPGQFPGMRSIHFCPQTADSVTDVPQVLLHRHGNGASGLAGSLAFVPDGVPAGVFDRYARARAGSGLCLPAGRPMAPCRVPLPGGGSPRAVANHWRANARSPLTPVAVGSSVAGDELFSFEDDGPHLLVGGTTGSGKSEFLRTLAGSLAVAHSPADLQFVFVDFKGGAGLGALRKFPHTSSLVTDLDGRGMERVLASLRAEIHRRETALSDAGAADANAYRSNPANTDGGDMAHVVVVIDEFRVLVDQCPDAMNELMRIAAVGRSLGIHLVMATQRPQGAVSADIRANVTSSVCLRVQTTFDSQDVIGSGDAASIGIDTPGRAFISRAGGSPTEFQCATLSPPAARAHLHPAAELATDHLQCQMAREDPALPTAGAKPAASADPRPALGRAPAKAPAMPESDVDAVAELLTAAWRLLSCPDRHGSAALEPCPAEIPAPDRAPTPSVAYAPSPVWTAAHAIVAPELPGELDLGRIAVAATGHSPWRGRTAADAVLLGLVDVPARQSLEPLLWSPALHSHLACIGPRAASSAALRLVAAQLVTSNEDNAGATQRYLYILDGDGTMQDFSGCPWVGSYVTPACLRTAARLLLRLSEPAVTTESRLGVVVSDWGRWVAAFRSSPWPWAEDSAGSLVRHGQANLAVVLGGERELLTAPFMAAVPNRVFLPFGASCESRLLWPRLPYFTPVPGRAALLGPINATAAGGQADDPHVAQLAAVTLGSRLKSRQAPPPPLIVTALPEHLSMEDARQALANAPARAAGICGATKTAVTGTQTSHTITVGLGGDCATPVCLSVAPGTFLPVLGAPGSGRTTFLSAVRDLNGAPDAILWVDDATLLAPDRLADISREVAAGCSALIALPNHLPSIARLPHEWGLRNAEQGIVLAPRRAQDGELFGMRLDAAGAVPPGRAVLIDRGQTEWFQFPALERPAA